MLYGDLLKITQDNALCDYCVNKDICMGGGISYHNGMQEPACVSLAKDADADDLFDVEEILKRYE